MTALSSLESQYDAFLFASLCENDEMTLSVLSLLARLDLDPWQEAGRLAQLSKEQAINSLASKIWKSNSERWSPSEASILAIRLIERLPSHGGFSSYSRSAEHSNNNMMLWLVVGALMGSIAIGGNSMRTLAKSSSTPDHSVSVAGQQEALPQSTRQVATD
jgi:hypothetical protein